MNYAFLFFICTYDLNSYQKGAGLSFFVIYLIIFVGSFGWFRRWEVGVDGQDKSGGFLFKFFVDGMFYAFEVWIEDFDK